MRYNIQRREETKILQPYKVLPFGGKHEGRIKRNEAGPRNTQLWKAGRRKQVET